MLQIVFGKKRQEYSPLELHSLTNMLTTTNKEQKLSRFLKMGLLNLGSQDFQAMHMKLFCSKTKRFPRKKFQHSRKMHLVIISKVNYSIHFKVPFLSSSKCTVVLFRCAYY
jgi:hypothetical protein